ncbi:N/A [soil metagenome]
MRSFSADELRMISDGVHTMYCAQSVASLCEHTFKLLASVIPNEVPLFDDRSFRGGWCEQFARLLEIDPRDLGPDESSPNDSKCGVRVVVGRHPLSVSPRGRFLLTLVQPHFARAKQLLDNSTAHEKHPIAAPGAKAIDLTPREQEVLYWVSEGKTNSEIGIILNASARTIQKHLEHIFQKLGVETRTSATVRAMELGIIATIAMSMA